MCKRSTSFTKHPSYQTSYKYRKKYGADATYLFCYWIFDYPNVHPAEDGQWRFTSIDPGLYTVQFVICLLNEYIKVFLCQGAFCHCAAFWIGDVNTATQLNGIAEGYLVTEGIFRCIYTPKFMQWPERCSVSILPSIARSRLCVNGRGRGPSNDDHLPLSIVL